MPYYIISNEIVSLKIRLIECLKKTVKTLIKCHLCSISVYSLIKFVEAQTAALILGYYEYIIIWFSLVGCQVNKVNSLACPVSIFHCRRKRCPYTAKPTLFNSYE